ncbi:Hypp8409 [Branchiostoma lanceolatum]|uniref:Hypp8409 protein n=1 Tax=Branchiostoma lanceolatum TaxID=7740 RepID=A0A8K0EH86_BRALA|nr:Hypp8409 [Branchiostoma lanceolatum]
MASWEKTKVQSLCDYETPQAGPVINAHQVEAVDRFCYLGGTISSDCRTDSDTHLRIGRAAATMASLDNIWCNRELSLQTKLYNSLVLSILMCEHLHLFGHIVWADPPLEPATPLREPTPTKWSRTRGTN